MYVCSLYVCPWVCDLEMKKKVRVQWSGCNYFLKSPPPIHPSRWQNLIRTTTCQYSFTIKPVQIQGLRLRQTSENITGTFTNQFLHLHEIVERLYFHFSLSVCLCVCPALPVNEIPAERMNDFDAVFAKRLLTALARTLLWFVTLGQRSRSQWRNIHCFSIILC